MKRIKDCINKKWVKIVFCSLVEMACAFGLSYYHCYIQNGRKVQAIAYLLLVIYNYCCAVYLIIDDKKDHKVLAVVNQVIFWILFAMFGMILY